jgi:predicted  nucleic acid-binding Zn-ribbon protein
VCREHARADVQKQDALDKAKAELESIEAKLAESAIALKDAQKGREDTVSWQEVIIVS